MARRIGQGIRAALPAVAQDFLRQQRMAIAASIDASGRVWASLLTGGPGFMQALDDRTVWVDAMPIGGDPLLENLAVCRDIGLLAIDLATRRRIRVNGTAELRSDGLYVYTQQVFSNCPKYIQARDFTPEDLAPGETPIVRRTALLTLGHQRALAQADTFFIATAHPEAGGDASHRGGNPGFVRVVDAGTLQFPDYPGNTMFQTLGNLEVNPRAGLLFIDFERGTTLQLTGKASVIWDAERRAAFTGAERVVEVHVEEAIEIEGGNKLRWRLLSYSPFNPA